MKLSYDLHLHSCLSPCGDEDMTPANLANMCALAGLDVVALTDHNTTGNCAPFVKVAKALGLVALSGMELCTREEIHVVCLFETPEAAQPLHDYVHERLLPLKNKPDLFGRQLWMDEEDGVLGEECAFLVGAADIGIDEVAELVHSMGGIAFPAHIDRPSFSLLSILGVWDETLGFSFAERTRDGLEKLRERHPELGSLPLIVNSDAHTLEQVLDPEYYINVSNKTEKEVLNYLSCLNCRN